MKTTTKRLLAKTVLPAGLVLALGSYIAISSASAAGPGRWNAWAPGAGLTADQVKVVAAAQQAIQTGTTQKIAGEVKAVKLTPPTPQIQIQKADGTTATVIIGPVATLYTQGVTPKVGDKIAVTGVDCLQGFVAVSLEAGGKTVSLKTNVGIGPRGAGARVGTGTGFGAAGSGATGFGQGRGMRGGRGGAMGYVFGWQQQAPTPTSNTTQSK